MADVDTGSLDKPNAPPAGLPVLLEEARRELRDDIVRGAGGRAALARFADRVDALLRQLFSTPRLEPSPSLRSRSWRSAATAAGSCACTPTSICSCCSAARIGADEERFVRALPASAVGSRRRRRPPGAGDRASSRSSRPTTPSSCWRCSTRGRWRATRALFDRFDDGLSSRPARTRTSLESLLRR